MWALTFDSGLSPSIDETNKTLVINVHFRLVDFSILSTVKANKVLKFSFHDNVLKLIGLLCGRSWAILVIESKIKTQRVDNLMVSFMKQLAKEYAIFFGILILTLVVYYVLTFALDVWGWVSLLATLAMVICLLRYAPFPFSIITMPIFNMLANADDSEIEIENDDSDLFSEHMEIQRRNLHDKAHKELIDPNYDKYLDPNFDGFE